MSQEEIDYWSNDPEYPLEDWRYEVANNDTRKGYWEWVNTQKVQAIINKGIEDGQV